jgi:hypothetical protein
MFGYLSENSAFYSTVSFHLMISAPLSESAIIKKSFLGLIFTNGCMMNLFVFFARKTPSTPLKISSWMYFFGILVDHKNYLENPNYHLLVGRRVGLIGLCDSAENSAGFLVHHIIVFLVVFRGDSTVQASVADSLPAGGPHVPLVKIPGEFIYY